MVAAFLRFPGEPNVGGFVASRCDALSTVPIARWDATESLAAARYGGFVRLEPLGARSMLPVEARAADPHQLLLLLAGCGALGAAPGSPATSVGVYVAVSARTLCGGAPFGGRRRRLDAYAATASSAAVLCGRLSFALGLSGPCLQVDTACSGFLVALHLATKGLGGDCDRVSVSGLGLLERSASDATAAAGMLSPSGRCHTFDGAADGFGRAEGASSYVLDADGRRSLVSAVRHDGRSASLTAPNGSSQQRLIEAVGIEAPGPLQSHGTGTALGDPVEVGAATRALSEANGVAFASVKASLGHLEAAAAAAGLECLRNALQDHGPANAALLTINEHLASFCVSARFPVEGAPVWRNVGRLSSFGFSGTIAHALVPPPTHSLDTPMSPVPRPQRTLAVTPLHASLSQAQQRASFSDHVVDGRALVPAVAYLEFAFTTQG